MKRFEPCPVCSLEVETHYDVIDVYEGQGPTCEESMQCGKHYSYEFFYGSYRVTVGNQEWCWSHNTNQAEVIFIQSEVTAAIKRAQYVTSH